MEREKRLTMEHGVVTIIVAITTMAAIIACFKQGHQIRPCRYALHTSKVTIHLKIIPLYLGTHDTCFSSRPVLASRHPLPRV